MPSLRERISKSTIYAPPILPAHFIRVLPTYRAWCRRRGVTLPPPRVQHYPTIPSSLSHAAIFDIFSFRSMKLHTGVSVGPVMTALTRDGRKHGQGLYYLQNSCQVIRRERTYLRRITFRKATAPASLVVSSRCWEVSEERRPRYSRIPRIRYPQGRP